MEIPEFHIVTGAFGYTGKYITHKLLSMGKRVKTLTGHPDRPNPFGDKVSVAPFNFDNKSELVKSLRGATVLYNTYWIRFPYGQVTFEKAIENTITLIRAAEKAGIKKIIHISVTNPSEDSHLPYFKGKGILEKSIIYSGLSYAIIRPALTFGIEDILINNIAWLLRRFPVFAIPGKGDYRLQPIFVEDLAEIAVNSAHSEENIIIDAVGSEIFTFDELVRLIADKINSRAKIIHLNPGISFFLSKVIGYFLNDVLLTVDELRGLMESLLITESPPNGNTKFSDWLDKNADVLGIDYASELDRHYR